MLAGNGEGGHLRRPEAGIATIAAVRFGEADEEPQSWPMSLAIISKLYIRKSQGQVEPLATSLTNIATPDAPDFISRDNLTLQVYLCDDGPTIYEPLTGGQIDAGDQIVFDGKAASDVEAADALFSATEFIEMVDGNGNYFYQANLDLTSDDLAAAILATGNGILPVICGVQVQSGGNINRLTYRFAGNVYYTPYLGTEGVPPVTGSPAYPPPGALLTDGTDTATIKRLSVPVPAGANTVAVAFNTAFALPPDTILCTVVKGNAGDDNNPFEAVDTVTAAGFNANLAGAAPAGQTLMVTAILSNQIAGAATPNLQRFRAPIPMGASVVPIVFPLPFAAPPTTVLATVLKGAPGDDSEAFTGPDTITANGCNGNLAGPCTAAGQYLLVVAMQ